MSTSMRIFDVVQSMSGQKNVIVLPRPYVRFFANAGDQQAHVLAAFLNQIVFWSGVDSSCDDGWFYKSHKEMGDDLEGLTEDQAGRLANKICKKYFPGIIETKSQKVNGTPTAHYRIVDETALISKIFPTSLDSAKVRNGNREYAELKTQKCGMETAEAQNQSRESAESYLYTDLNSDKNLQIIKPSCLPAAPTDGEEFISEKLTREATEVIKHLSVLTGVTFEPTDGNLQHIRARLRNATATPADLMAVVDHLCASWLGTKYSKGLNPAKIFSSEKFPSNLIAAKAWVAAGRPSCRSDERANAAGSAIERDEAYANLVEKRRKPKNRLEEIAKVIAGRVGFPGRRTTFEARADWKSIWAQAVEQASEEDLARIPA